MAQVSKAWWPYRGYLIAFLIAGIVAAPFVYYVLQQGITTLVRHDLVAALTAQYPDLTFDSNNGEDSRAIYLTVLGVTPGDKATQASIELWIANLKAARHWKVTIWLHFGYDGWTASDTKL